MRTADEWLKVAKEAADMGCLFLLLTGGEPLLHPEFKQIYRGLQELGIYLTVNTNGTLIDEEMADFFASNLPRRLNITLYGAGRETYQRLCQNGAAYDQVMNGIRLLKERNVPIKLNATLTQFSIGDFQAIMDVADGLELPIEIPYYLFPQARKANQAEPLEYRLMPEEAARLRLDIVKHGFRGSQEEYIRDLKETVTSIDSFEEQNLPEQPKGFWCASGRSSFWVNWKGQMTNCGMLEIPYVDVFELPFKENWECLLAETGSVRLSEVCYRCKYRIICSPCAASMLSETGSFGDVPVYKCEVMHAYDALLREELRRLETGEA